MRDLVSLPKAELHLHLEGSIQVDTVRELADRIGRPVPPALGADDTWHFDGFAHFIDSYGEVCDLLHELDDFRRVALELCGALAAQGVRYAEVVFSPAQHAGRLGDWYGPIEAVLDGFAAGERDHGVIARLEPDFIRDFDEERNVGTLEVALKYAGRGVVAINSAGSERQPVDRYAHLMRQAIECGTAVRSARRGVGRPGERLGHASHAATVPHRARRPLGRGSRDWSPTSPTSGCPSRCVRHRTSPPACTPRSTIIRSRDSASRVSW